jgi:DNA-binding winged helix-turn-helix (wHTH) protein
MNWDDYHREKMGNEPNRRVRFGPYLVDFHSQEVWKHGLKLKLNGQPFQILEMLIMRPGEMVTRAEIQRRLWPGDVFVDSNHGLNAAVNKLRDILCDAADNPKYIETLPRRGYRFIGNVAPQTTQPVVPVVPIVVQAQEKRPIQESAAIMPPRVERWKAALAAAVLAASGLGIVVVWGGKSGTAAEVERQRQKTSDEMFAMNTAGNAQRAVPVTKSEANSLEGAAGRQKKTADEALSVLGERQNANGEKRFNPAPAADLSSARSGPVLRTVVAGDSGNAGPQFSPDAKRIAFMSNRTGPWQIWLSNADGSQPRQVSFTQSAGTPRWSLDGRSIAFDAPDEDETWIFVVNVDSNEAARRLVQGYVPSYSRDGKWIYFASDRNDGWQVWKVPVRGGTQIQVTRAGGFAALESDDGYLYYSKSRDPQPEICRVPVNGGAEECVLQHLRPRTWASWAVTREGIVFAEDLPNGQSALSIYDPNRKSVHDLVPLTSAPFWVGASADGKKAIMNDAAERQISMVDNLR